MILASDLDRTLVHPVRTLPADLRAGTVVVETLDGRPISCASRRTLALLREVAAEAELVPVTTRSREQLGRLSAITGAGGRWAVCANGGTVLHEGVPDAGWEAALAVRLQAAAPLGEVRRAVARAIGPASADGWRLRERTCDGLFLYSVCRASAIPTGAAGAVRDAVGPLGWTATLSGRKLYVLPTALTKEAAIAHVRDRIGDHRTLVAAGDSELDRGLLETADLGLVPARSELAGAPYRLPAHVVVTRARHVAAAEELLTSALRRHVAAAVVRSPDVTRSTS